MNLRQRKDLLLKLGRSLDTAESALEDVKSKALSANPWFIPQFIDHAMRGITEGFLTEEALQSLIDRYELKDQPREQLRVGIVMAGNIPLVGFHDLLCVFMAGHVAVMKLSSKDEVLMTFIVNRMIELDPSAGNLLVISERLTGCDAYIATGSNNSSRYFEYYFGKFPHIIRRNRTSVAVVKGNETTGDLSGLSDDVHLYFGLGCRNVSKLYVPREYDFVPMLNAFKKYSFLSDQNKYHNNYDYNLAIHLLNHRYYMSNETILLVEDEAIFSPVAQLNYEYFDDEVKLGAMLQQLHDVQCVVGDGYIKFGAAQRPGIFDFADGVDTMAFLVKAV